MHWDARGREHGADMAGRRGAGKLTATAAVLTLPLWLACCAPGADQSADRAFPAGGTTYERTMPADGLLVPEPQPQALPPATPVPPGGDPAQTAKSQTQPGQTQPGSGTLTPPTPPPSGLTTGPGGNGGAAVAAGTEATSGEDPAVPVRPSPTPAPVSPPQPAETPAGTSGAKAGVTQTVTAYYVLLDDGGASGVRFGCNDSLAGIRQSVTGTAEPLAAAMRALLDRPAPDGLYNALSASTVTFLSGSFDGTTVTVYISGTIRPGGACDIPRVEAQLTQTAVASVGAIRAEVYVNGTPLPEALRLK